MTQDEAKNRTEIPDCVKVGGVVEGHLKENPLAELPQPEAKDE